MGPNEFCNSNRRQRYIKVYDWQIIVLTLYFIDTSVTEIAEYSMRQKRILMI